jgi:hypothetical protein
MGASVPTMAPGGGRWFAGTMSVPLLFLVLATGFNGLLAGLYAAFSVAVMPGLARADDRTLIGTMVWINERILNLWFIALFLGSPLLAVAAARLALADGASRWASRSSPSPVAVMAMSLRSSSGSGRSASVRLPVVSPTPTSRPRRPS